MVELANIKCRMVKEGITKYPVEKVSSPQDVVKIFRAQYGMEDREHMGILLLNNKNIPIGFHTVSVGSINSSIVHPREVFKVAILANAAAIILGHNHPSGVTTPSNEDTRITSRLVDAGRILGIEVLDHVIVGPETDYYSFKEKGVIICD